MKNTFFIPLCIALLSGCTTPKPIRPSPSLTSIYEYEGRDGKAEALTDIKAGTPKLKTYGLPSPACGKYSEILKEKTGIEFHPIAGCCVDEPLLKYAASYNKTIEAYAEEKYGIGILDKLWTEAETEFNKSEEKEPNQAPEPTTTAVTPPAAQEPRQL
jgi:hypothetical protein